jgi:magnesium-transporting ATPase (P-type)
MREWVDAGAIFAVTLVNATIEFVQESKAENAIAALAKSVTTEATATRDGQKIRLDSRELVPGDLVLLASGDKVPADLRLVSVRDLQVSEAGLTGESLPLSKATAEIAAATVLADRTNMAYAGSLVTFGQAQGLVVAIGDRTEAALKQADIGIAMGITGTEVAKEAADMVLTDDNFATIASAVEEGRTVYSNLIKTIEFILPINGGEAMTILVGILASANLPILPVQILWVNMVSSVALTATLAFEPTLRGTMKRSPRRPNRPLLSSQLLWRISIVSAFNLIAVFGIFEWTIRTTDNLTLARTMAVHALVSAEVFYLLSVSQFVPSLLVRLKDSVTKKRPQPIAYVPAIGIGCALIFQTLFSQLAFFNPILTTQPIDPLQALICIGAGIPVIIPALLLKRFAPLG